MTQFEKSFYASNRKKLQALLGENQVALITAHRQIEMSRDVELPFSQERNFHYLTGDVKSQQMVLAVSAQRSVLMGIEPSALDVQWNGVPTLTEVAESAGIKDVVALDSLSDGLLQQELKGKAVLLVAPRVATTSSVVMNPAHSELRAALDGMQWSDNGDLNLMLADIRAIKTDREIKLIDRLAATTISVIQQLESQLFSLETERVVSNEIEYRIKQAGFDGYGFTPIVAAAANAATIHHRSSESALKKDGVLLLDIGAGSGFYSADISRTFNGPKGSPRQQDIIERLTAVQSELIELVAPGITFIELEEKAERLIGEQLIDFRIISGKPTRKKIRKHYGHGFGHSLGLDVHDPVDYQKPLAANMIITVEPGIYLPDEKAGYRVEDDVLVVDGGRRILGV